MLALVKLIHLQHSLMQLWCSWQPWFQFSAILPWRQLFWMFLQLPLDQNLLSLCHLFQAQLLSFMPIWPTSHVSRALISYQVGLPWLHLIWLLILFPLYPSLVCVRLPMLLKGKYGSFRPFVRNLEEKKSRMWMVLSYAFYHFPHSFLNPVPHVLVTHSLCIVACNIHNKPPSHTHSLISTPLHHPLWPIRLLAGLTMDAFPAGGLHFCDNGARLWWMKVLVLLGWDWVSMGEDK